jgi:pimeloyl-ACP methyl ester carboxylesterase
MTSNTTTTTPAAATAEDRIFRILGTVLRATDAVSTRLASRLLYWLWCHPIRHRPSPREIAFKREAEASEFRVNGVAYKLYAQGQGPAVLLVHGWDGRGTQMMAFAKPLVDAGLRVLIFDAHGHGESPGKQTNGVIISDMVAEIARQAGGLYAIVAHSMGGSFALVALEKIEVERIVLIAPPQSMETVYEKVEKRLGVPSRPGELFKQQFARDFPNVWTRFSTEKNVARLGHVKGLVVQDADDDFVLPHEGRAVHHAWPGSELFMTEGYGHRKILRAEPVVRRVAEFLRRDR